MKKAAFIVLIITLAFACKSETAEKPKHFLTEKQIEDIFYDISLLQGIKSFTPQTLKDNNVDAKTYIYKKYKIDSLTLAQNNAYYAADIDAYEKMHQRVAERINADKEKLEPKKAPLKPLNLTPKQKALLDKKRKANLNKVLSEQKKHP